MPRLARLLLGSLLLLLSAAAPAGALTQTVTDADDDANALYQHSTDLRSVGWSDEAVPGAFRLTGELEWAPGSDFDAAVLLDTDFDGVTDDAIDITRNDGYDPYQGGSTHPDTLGGGGRLRYKLRRSLYSTQECQIYDNGVYGEAYDAGVTTLVGDPGAQRTRFTIDVPKAAIGNPPGFRWAVMGSSSARDGFVENDYVPDATDGRPVTPYPEGDLSYCTPDGEMQGRAYGVLARMAQGATFGYTTPLPTVTATHSPATPRPGQTVTFEASVGSGATASGYRWDFDGDGSWDTGLVSGPVTHAYATEGTRFVRVQAPLLDGRTATGEHTVPVVDRAPTVSIEHSGYARPGVATTLKANAADDGAIAAIHWDLDADGQYDDATGATTSATFPEGTVTVGVRVTDDAGKVAFADKRIVVSDRPPSITLTASNPTPATKEKFTVTADVADDMPIREDAIEWGFDANPGDEFDPFDKHRGRTWELSFGVPGTYRIQARYVDDTGKVGRAVVEVVVPNLPPTFREIRVRKAYTPDQPFNAAPLVKGEQLYLETLLYDDDLQRPVVDWDLDGDGDYDDARGEKVTTTYPTGGIKEVRSRITDTAGNVARGRTDFEVLESAEAGCGGKVEVDAMRLTGCFKTDKDGMKVTPKGAKVEMNGLRIQAAKDAVIKVDPKTGVIQSASPASSAPAGPTTETGKGLPPTVFSDTDSVEIWAGTTLLYRGRIHMDPACDKTKQECLAFESAVPAISNVKGLPLKGDVAVYFTPRGTRVKANVDVLGSIGLGATARIDLTVVDGVGLDLDDLEIRTPMLPLPKNLSIGQFFLTYTKADKRWHGGGDITLPTPSFTKLTGDLAFSEVTGFERAHGEIDGLNVPIDPLATVYLQRIAFTLEIKGEGPNLRVRMGGGVGVSMGPRIAGMDALTGDGDFLFTFGWPFGLDMEGRMSVAGYDILGGTLGARSNGTAYASGFIGIGFPFPRGAKGARTDGTKYKVSKFSPSAEVYNPFQLVTIKGTMSAWVEPQAFNLEAEVAAKVIGITLIGAKALMSSKGVAGCGEVLKHISGGFGYEWETEKLTTFSDSCDLGPWKPARLYAPVDGEGTGRLPFAAHAGTDDGTRTFEVAKGQRALMLKVDGRGGDPLVELVDPDGRSWKVPADRDVVQTDAFFVTKHPQEDATIIGVGDPRPGRWTLRRLSGSVALQEVSGADVRPEPSVKATVRGTGNRQVIDYRIKPIPGQVVRFAEYGGKAVHREIGVAQGASGSMPFTPMLEKVKARKVVAIVEQDGLPRRQFDVARFRAPGLQRLRRVDGLRARRTAGRRLRVTWSPRAGARRYQVLATMTDGRGIFREVRSPHAVFEGVDLRDAAVVDVRATDKRNLSSRLRRVVLPGGQRFTRGSFGLGLRAPGRCVSRRSFAVTLRRDLRSALVAIDGYAVRRLRGTRLRTRIDLRGMPAGRFRVSIVGRTKAGTRVNDDRVYRTCVPGKRGR